MTEKKRPAKNTRARPSPTAPEFISPSFRAWNEASADPQFRDDIKAGLADAKAGKTRPWAEIRKRTPSS